MKCYDKLVEIIYNLNWLYFPDHPFRMLIIGDKAHERLMCY